MAVVGAKAKAIDKVLQDRHDGGFEDVIVWPQPPTPTPQKKQVKEEDFLDYGYGEAEPTPRGNTQAPRRSSLSNKNDPNRRTNRRASIGYSGEMTLVLPNKETVKKRRSITFSDDDTVHSIDTYDDPDADNEILNNKRQLWFREEEYRHIERNIRNLVKDSQNNGTERPTWIELRGLEGIMDDASAVERHNAIQSVLEDQRRQKQAGVYDEHAIATEYQYNSLDAQVLANERAKRDEKEIEGYMEKTKQVHRRLQHRRMSC